MAVVMPVSRREGQVTFCISERTSCMNLKGLVRAILSLTAFRPMNRRRKDHNDPSADGRTS
jgi:hypothetical protein